MNLKKHFGVLTAAALVMFISSGCSHRYQFQDRAALTDAQDREASRVPDKNGFEFVEYAVTSSVRYPLVRAMDPRRIKRSGDVNALDEVPASSWFTPRLGSRALTPEELVKGPQEKGAPLLPLTITAAKTKGNSPGFIVKDARGLKYLIKFDQSQYPALESTVNFVVNRLFWGFGYQVSEDSIISVSREDFTLAPDISKEKVEKVFAFSAADNDKRYRATASLFLTGEILGPIAAKGTRKDDLNDRIPHENRRVLRALRMFCAWMDNSGMRSDNSLDVYQGKPGEGHTVHYLVDFGEAFGVHGIEKDRAWDGFEHFFSWADTAKNFASLGVPVKPWETRRFGSSVFQESFDAELFEPGTWKETTQFLPMRLSQPEDDYWAAKILASLNRDHLEALFKAAAHPDPEYSASVIQTLWKRREKVLAYAYRRVTPLEFSRLDATSLSLKDLSESLPENTGSRKYTVRFFKSNGRSAGKPLTLTKDPGGNLEIPLSAALADSGDYLIVEIKSSQSEKAAEFHLAGSGGQTPRLAGIVR